MELGGFKSDEYLAINPQGKVPALKCESTGLCIAESDTVARYLMSTYASEGPSFQPDNPISNMIARFHDIYLTSIQMCLYKVRIILR
jgi:glutathione S-transferase